MKTWYFFLMVVGFCFFQVTFLNNFRVIGVKPDFLLAAVVIASLNYRWQSALFLSITSGVLKDVFGINAFGVNTFLFCFWCIMIMVLSRKISVENRPFMLVLMLIVAFFNAAFTRLLLAFSGNLIRWSVFLRISVIESLYTALILPLILKLSAPILAMQEEKQEGTDDLEEQQI